MPARLAPEIPPPPPRQERRPPRHEVPVRSIELIAVRGNTSQQRSTPIVEQRLERDLAA